MVTGSIQHWLLHLHGPVVYVGVGVLVFLEMAILVGFVVPGEIAAVIGGVLVSQHHANLAVMILVVVVTATGGNIVGYEVGRILGPRLMAHRPLRGNPGVMKTQQFIARRGAPAVFFGRWVVFVRAVLPGMAGMSGMSRRSFALMSAAGGVAWGSMWVLVGYGAGLSYTKVLSQAGVWGAGVAVVVVAALVVFMVLRSRRERRSLEAQDP